MSDYLKTAREALAEHIASEGLDISGYAGKWKASQQYVKRMRDKGYVFRDDRHLLPYWEQVRLEFLERGGERVDGMRV